MTVKDLAQIITCYVNAKGEPISPKKLQKLMYYVEAWNLVHLETPFFEENFEAWVHGPVLPSLYTTLKDFKFNNIKIINDEIGDSYGIMDSIVEANKLSAEEVELIHSVLNNYGHLTAFELEMLTHNEKPWIDARNNVPPHLPCRNIISKKSMKEFYTSQIEINV